MPQVLPLLQDYFETLCNEMCVLNGNYKDYRADEYGYKSKNGQ